MKRVICTNAKSYRLTVDQEYEIEVLNNGYYQVVNDVGRSVRYSSDLFEDVVIQTTVQETLNSLTFTKLDMNQLRIQFNFDQEDINLIVNNLTEEGTNVSCGVRQLYGINGFTGAMLSALEPYNRENLIQTIMRRAYQYIIDNAESCAFILLSTNQNDTNFEASNNILSEIAVTSSEAENPNSNNMITLWVVDKTI